MAEGESVISDPLDSSDTRSALELCRGLGAEIELTGGDAGSWRVRGTGGRLKPAFIDVGNSGTSLYLAAAIAAAGSEEVTFDGDEQIRRRSAAPLLGALRELGAEVTEKGAPGCAPFSVRGPLRGGSVSIECPTSQYLSALLLAAPLAPPGAETEINVPLLWERPYAEMTLRWLEDEGISLRRRGLDWFSIPGGQSYHSFSRSIPADFSSATFFFCAAAVSGSTLLLEGLDLGDSQGDKEVLPILEAMGCTVSSSTGGSSVGSSGGILISAPPEGLRGGVFDLNAIPDALPALAATACFARGETRLVNVPQARIKETDRIAVMAAELAALGAVTEELPDGLVIRGGERASLRGGTVRGHGDHRVIMAAAVAALGAADPITIDDDEAVAVTFPDFFPLLESIRKV
jgi:3-phosphoshikimate 1-carboxyvinyltransferase